MFFFIFTSIVSSILSFFSNVLCGISGLEQEFLQILFWFCILCVATGMSLHLANGFELAIFVFGIVRAQAAKA